VLCITIVLKILGSGRSTGRALPSVQNRGGERFFLSAKAWGGRFEEPTDRQVEQFTESVSFDHRLAACDVAGSVAHVEMLAEVGLIEAEECRRLVEALRTIGEEIARGELPLRADLEDIHMHVEQALIERLGDVGRKVHTGRSRNDQVSTDLRLWVRGAIDETDGLLVELQRAFVGRCERDREVILPGYTHLQRAQPVLAAHYWLAYCEKLERDRKRLADCRRRVNLLPLGTAALAGSSLPLDRELVACKLGFAGLVENSLDASSDRDFVVEFVFDLAMIAEHLGGWAEEWILWSTTEFGFLRLPEAYCTGSSIMPQKKNPDVLELVRGRTARVIGDLNTLLALVKGLPLAYNRDLQEDKPPLFDAFDTVRGCLQMAGAVVAGAELNRDAIAGRLDEGFLDATTLMEYLVAQGVPMRTGHELVGKLVKACEGRQCRLADLSLEELQEASPAIEGDVYDHLGVEGAVAALRTRGSSGKAPVWEQIRRWRERLEEK
jgi:argininosuccinate lyase